MANGEGGISIGTIIMGIIAYNMFFSGDDEEKTIKKLVPLNSPDGTDTVIEKTIPKNDIITFETPMETIEEITMETIDTVNEESNWQNELEWDE